MSSRLVTFAAFSSAPDRAVMDSGTFCSFSALRRAVTTSTSVLPVPAFALAGGFWAPAVLEAAADWA